MAFAHAKRGIRSVSYKILACSIFLLGAGIFFLLEATYPNAQAFTVEYFPHASPPVSASSTPEIQSQTETFPYHFDAFHVDEAPESVIDVVALKLAWTKVKEAKVDEPAPVEEILEFEPEPIPPTEEIPPVSEETSIEPSEPEAETPVEDVVEVPVETQTEMSAENSNVTIEAIPVLEAIESVPAPEEPSTSAAVEESLVGYIISTVTNAVNQIITFTLGESDEAVPEEVPAKATTTETVGPLTDEHAPAPDNVIEGTLFEVLFSVDGTTWQSLGNIDVDTEQSAVIEVPVSSVIDLANIQIGIRPASSDAEEQKLNFDSVSIEVGYSDLLEELITPVDSGLVDQTPNFSISSIKSDVQSGTIRAVLLEKGGMLELWYSITDMSTKNATWKLLAGDGSISESSPIDIKGKTIFWLDKNQQTLFGFSIDTQSVIGNSTLDDATKVISLDFVDSRFGNMRVNFNLSNNVFEYARQ